MWTYHQLSGELERDGIVGYSGHDTCRNDPGKQDVPMHGPICRGRYAIGDPFDSQIHGPFVMRLTPAASNEMFGRSGFLMHGDSAAAPGTASEGCIVVGRCVRRSVVESGDRDLQVTE